MNKSHTNKCHFFKQWKMHVKTFCSRTARVGYGIPGGFFFIIAYIYNKHPELSLLCYIEHDLTYDNCVLNLLVQFEKNGMLWQTC